MDHSNMDMSGDKSADTGAMDMSGGDAKSDMGGMDMSGGDTKSDMGGMDMSGGTMDMDHDMGGMQMYMYWNTKVTFLVKGSFYLF